MIYTTTISSPLGLLTLAAENDSLIGLWTYNQKYHGSLIHKDMVKNADLPVFKLTQLWLIKYFNGKNPPLSEIPFSLNTTSEFRKAVWQILCNIPYGKVLTYGEIAKKIAKQFNKETMSSQAVGGAVGHNPISIIIPCHRVVGTNNSLTGYAGGLDKKMQLLTIEGIDISKYTGNTLANNLVDFTAHVDSGQVFSRDTIPLFCSPLFVKAMQNLMDKNIITSSCGSGKERGILPGITCKFDDSLSPKNKILAEQLKISPTEFRIGAIINDTTTFAEFETALQDIVNQFSPQ